MQHKFSPKVETAIEEGVSRLRNGQVIGLPTETVYGLAGDISQAGALELIFKTKARPFFDPLIVHVENPEQVLKLVHELPETAKVLMKKFWPGPLTLVLPKARSVSPLITSGLETVGIRMPNHPVALEVIRRLGQPVAAPSANMFGKTSPTTAEHVRSEFGERVFVIDGGPCEIGIESTVVGFEKNKVVIYRPGQLSKTELTAALSSGDLQNISVEIKESPVAPGHLKHHYMPNIPVVLIDTTSADFEFESDRRQQITQELKLQAWQPAELDLGSEPRTAARLLYSELRRLAESGASFIFVRKTQKKSSEAWSGIWNRLEKAASLRME